MAKQIFMIGCFSYPQLRSGRVRALEEQAAQDI